MATPGKTIVPKALLMADKLFPVRLHAPGLAGTEIADNYFSSLICSYARSLMGFSMDKRFDKIRGPVRALMLAHAAAL
ncbi:MAG: 2-hydroxyacyl-CoA dehydratase family protein [Smithella sp.]|jgi:benzoyl-CoA reductase/2-hydroxyglutaryl-CoA dehydratase subunit BcrC/BadD/HgdB